MTAGALAASGTAARAAALPGGAGAGGADIVRLPFPYGFRSPFGVGGDETARLSARYLAGLLADEASGVPAPAVLLLETVQGEGGVVPAPDAWVRSIRAITAEHGVPLAVDEVQTGVGRTGSFWGVDRSGIEPDIMIMSKAIGGSLPLAVLAYREDLDVWPPGAHTGTFRGNQLAMAAGTATLRYVAEHGLSARAEEVGARMTAELGQLRRDHPCVGDVRGRGLMIGIELVDPSRPGLDGAGAPASGTAAAVRTECLRRGLVIEVGGRGDAVVRLLPPLVITDEQAASVVTRLTDAVAAAERAGTGAGARASA
jgi:diaminobutyrate-2-oxoglutarate transaminase